MYIPFCWENNIFEKIKKILNLGLTFSFLFAIISLAVADVAHLVERHLAKVEVASSSLVIRSMKKPLSSDKGFLFFIIRLKKFLADVIMNVTNRMGGKFMYNILICDDEADIRSALKIYLAGSDDYNIIEAENGSQALEIIKKQNIHLLLMDIMMPVMDGLRALARLREDGNNIPVILLTAKSQDTDKIMGLNLGADDYITKPFNHVEVIARVKSQIRRYVRFGGSADAQPKSDILRNGGIELDVAAKSVTVNGEHVNLTPTEMMLLKFFMENTDKVFPPKQIYRLVWGDDPLGAENTVTVHIRHLREKIEIDPANPELLIASWGHGYKMVSKKVPEKISRRDDT